MMEARLQLAACHISGRGEDEWVWVWLVLRIRPNNVPLSNSNKKKVYRDERKFPVMLVTACHLYIWPLGVRLCGLRAAALLPVLRDILAVARSVNKPSEATAARWSCLLWMLQLLKASAACSLPCCSCAFGKKCFSLSLQRVAERHSQQNNQLPRYHQTGAGAKNDVFN